MKYLILSTYPYNGSRNIGDDLLEKSLCKLIKEADKEACIVVKYLTDKNLVFDTEDIDAVAGVISINPGYTADKYIENVIYVLEKAKNNNIPVYLILASKFYPITPKEMNKLQVNKRYRRALCELGKRGNLVARDLFSLRTAVNNRITCKECIGDIALYDSKYIGKEIRNPERIQKIAVSLPHNKLWLKNAVVLANKLKNRYQCSCILTIHGKTDIQTIESEIDRYQLRVMDLTGGGGGSLEFYETVDLHVGFRLHAHIYCLRIRKPSVLIAEDSRSGGHLYTFKGAGADGTPLLVKRILDSLPEAYRAELSNRMQLAKAFAMRKVCNAVDREINSEFEKTKKTFKRIDRYYIQKVKPFINSIVRK